MNTVASRVEIEPCRIDDIPSSPKNALIDYALRTLLRII